MSADLVQLFLLFLLIGFIAQAIDGALGMAFGVITNSLMVGVMGVPPAQASARVHIVETFTTAVSGLSHLYHRNIDRRLFVKLLVPGMIGGAAGAYLLSNIDGQVIKPFILVYLAMIGLYLLIRGLLYPPTHQRPKVVEPLGLVGGFLDAIGGGGWGPIVTSNLLVQGAEPRKVVGTVSSVEFFLTLTISATFVSQLGFADFAVGTLGLLVGGVMAAPFGAILAKRIKARTLLIAVGTVLTLTSLFSLVTALA